MSLEVSKLPSKANILGGPVSNERENSLDNYTHIGFLEESDLFFFFNSSVAVINYLKPNLDIVVL